MSRPLRIEYPGAWYHVMNHGAAKADIFDTDDDRRVFLGLLVDVQKRFAIETHSYCLMDDHYHLLLHTPQGGLARGMRHVNGLYTQYLNRKRATDGARFKGRYKSIIVEDDIYLLRVSRYIHLNPVASGLVDDPVAYTGSSCRDYVYAKQRFAALERKHLLDMIGGPSPAAQRRRYRVFVKQGLDDATQTFYARQRMLPAFGSDAFRNQLAAGQAHDPEIPELGRLRARPALDEIRDLVHRCSQRQGGISKQQQRDIALYLAQMQGYRLKEMTAVFGLRHYASVSSAIRRLDLDDAVIRDVIRACEQQITHA